MTTSYGEVNYADEVPSNKKLDNGKEVWLRLDNGDNEIRLVTAPYQYLTHKVKKDPTDKRDFGQKVNCSAPNGSCDACQYGEAKPRYLYGAIHRKDGTFRILDVSFNTFLQIRKLAQNVARWGDPTKYDINILKDPSAGAVGYYSVQPLPKEPLSAADQQIRGPRESEHLYFLGAESRDANLRHPHGKLGNGLDFGEFGGPFVNRPVIPVHREAMHGQNVYMA